MVILAHEAPVGRSLLLGALERAPTRTKLTRQLLQDRDRVERVKEGAGSAGHPNRTSAEGAAAAGRHRGEPARAGDAWSPDPRRWGEWQGAARISIRPTRPAACACENGIVRLHRAEAIRDSGAFARFPARRKRPPSR